MDELKQRLIEAILADCRCSSEAIPYELHQLIGEVTDMWACYQSKQARSFERILVAYINRQYGAGGSDVP